ncbi:MAG: response regulator [Opitutales bacterium]|nr:response regulator [Opitutales bacterium]NRA26525.1 response regulator [Opitutales bacterium]
MGLKVLTVDDSKAVRMIVKKAFKTFDVNIVEAANGVEGLAAAAKEKPDLILLDVTMPVMDGVEMLTKLKADPDLKGIPVIMLTAEAGRENVMKIAKIGIRDYVVKPFKEESLIDKVGRVIDLRPKEEKQTKQKGIDDNCFILVVDDKPAIIDQVSQGLGGANWKVAGVKTTGEAIDYCQNNKPDAIMISLSLPEESAFTLFRILRSNMKTKYIPIFGLVVKSETHLQQQATQSGFSAIVTKPIDFDELGNKLAKAINLDTSKRYFFREGDFFILQLPADLTPNRQNEITGYLKPQVSEAVDAGLTKVVIDATELNALDTGGLKLLIMGNDLCKDLGLSLSMAGSEKVIEECKSYAESKDWVMHSSLEDAKAAPVA